MTAYKLFLNADISKMRNSYAGNAAAWTDEEVYADYTTYRGPAPQKQAA